MHAPCRPGLVAVADVVAMVALAEDQDRSKPRLPDHARRARHRIKPRSAPSNSRPAMSHHSQPMCSETRPSVEPHTAGARDQAPVHRHAEDPDAGRPAGTSTLPTEARPPACPAPAAPSLHSPEAPHRQAQDPTAVTTSTARRAPPSRTTCPASVGPRNQAQDAGTDWARRPPPSSTAPPGRPSPSPRPSSREPCRPHSPPAGPASTHRPPRAPRPGPHRQARPTMPSSSPSPPRPAPASGSRAS